MLTIDLEDAVSRDDKPKARSIALDYLAEGGTGETARTLRISSIQTRFGLDGVTAPLNSDADPDFIVLPKTEAAQDLRLLGHWLILGKKKARLVASIDPAKALISIARPEFHDELTKSAKALFLI